VRHQYNLACLMDGFSGVLPRGPTHETEQCFRAKQGLSKGGALSLSKGFMSGSVVAAGWVM